MPAPHVAFRRLDGDQAISHLDEYRTLYAEVYAEPPYEWGDNHADLFVDRFQVQRRQPGFALVEARDGTELAGLVFGVTLQPTTPWWNNLTAPLPAAITTENPGRTFALVELLVRPPWRHQGIALALHDRLLKDRTEERADAHRPACSRTGTDRLPEVGLAQGRPEAQPTARLTPVRRNAQTAFARQLTGTTRTNVVSCK